jgi:hypothetical protein
MLIDKDKQTYNVRPLLEAEGFKFPPAASATYVAPAKKLSIVTTDPEQLIQIDEFLVFGTKPPQ